MGSSFSVNQKPPKDIEVDAMLGCHYGTISLSPRGQKDQMDYIVEQENSNLFPAFFFRAAVKFSVFFLIPQFFTGVFTIFRSLRVKFFLIIQNGIENKTTLFQKIPYYAKFVIQTVSKNIFSKNKGVHFPAYISIHHRGGK